MVTVTCQTTCQGGEQVNRRALVLEMDSTHVTLLSDDGEFIRLPAGRLPQARYIGQSISMSQIKPKSKMGWMPLLAACIFIALVVIPMVSPPPGSGLGQPGQLFQPGSVGGWRIQRQGNPSFK